VGKGREDGGVQIGWREEVGDGEGVMCTLVTGRYYVQDSGSKVLCAGSAK